MTNTTIQKKYIYFEKIYNKYAVGHMKIMYIF